MLLIDLFLGLVVLLISFLMWKYPVGLTLTLIAAAALSQLTGIGASGMQFGVDLYPLDIACAALIACCAIVFLRTGSLPRDVCRPALILLGLAILNFGRGVLVFGLKAPGNYARGLIYLILPVVVFSSLGAGIRITVERLVTGLSIAASILATVSVARWAGVLPIPEEMAGDDFREVARVLPADYAMVIGLALIGLIGLELMRGFRPKGIMIAASFAGLVFALQHRSVWIATITGLVWLILRSPRLARREWLKACCLALLLGSALTLAPLVASGTVEKALHLVRSNVDEVEDEDSTWAWRVAGYSEAVQRLFSNGLVETALGPPSGRDLSDKASFASTHIHSRYVDVFANYGMAGLVVLIVWLFSTAARIRRLSSLGAQNRNARIEQVILEATLVSILVYFVPYSGGLLQGSLLGSIWLASAAQRAAEGEAAFSVARQASTLKSSWQPLAAPAAWKKASGPRYSQ
jgi:hypothetical protein